MQNWLLNSDERDSAWSTFFPRAGDRVAVELIAVLDALRTRCNAKRYLVSSNPISSAMPLCRAIGVVVTPICGAWVLDTIALIVSTRLTARLTAFSLAHDNDVKVHFFDEAAICKEKKSAIKWRYDMFHPLEKDGHDIFADKCDEILKTSESIWQIAKKKTSDLVRTQFASNGVFWSALDLVSSVFITIMLATVFSPICWLFFIERPRPSKMRLFGLLPYVALAFARRSIIAIVVFFNGVLFHAGFPMNNTVKRYDVCCNIALGVYVFSDQFSKSTLVPALIMSAVLGFIMNIGRGKHDNLETFVHIVVVQWMCFYALLLSDL